ncbi:ABC transporter permease subunit [Halopiger djelfimassiliensis]|uniref:ABC transporter permease subunit n=1 Tax=Halopiger djelfimassiliensis TaxID=1293047 RepID=UPI0006781EA8|nr:ABC transporter permease subunit [Halopiger djelfimassiliensis]
MNWQSTARKDFRDAIRSRTIWLLLIGFVGLFILGNVVFGPRSGPFDGFVETTFANVHGLLPIVGIVLGYKAVLYERESGSLVLSLSLPQSRRDFVVGKLVGRLLVLTIPVVVGLIVGGSIAVVQYESVSLAPYLAFVVATVLYGAVFVSIALACSMSTTAGRQVLIRAIGAYVVLDLGWNWFINQFVRLLYRFRIALPSDMPDWAVGLQLASPSEAYRHLVATLFEIGGSQAHLAATTPWYVNPVTALIVLCGWLVVPLALGYLQFSTADL